MIRKLKGKDIDETLSTEKEYNVLSGSLTEAQLKTLSKYFNLNPYKKNVDKGDGLTLIHYKNEAWIVSDDENLISQVSDYLDESNVLNEYRRISIMRNAKDTPARIKRASQIHNVVPEDLDEEYFVSTGNLKLSYRVKGKYTDTIIIEGAMRSITTSMTLAKKTPETIVYSDMLNYLAIAMKNLDMYVHCSCPDFKYRFAYKSTKRQYNSGSPENRPAWITNPKDRGSVCKHLYAVLNNNVWIYKMIPQIIRCVKSHPDDFNTENTLGVKSKLPDDSSSSTSTTGDNNSTNNPSSSQSNHPSTSPKISNSDSDNDNDNTAGGNSSSSGSWY